MSDLEDFGLLFAPHISAGRIPTDLGVKLFVDGLLEIGNLSLEERHNLESSLAGTDGNLEGLMEQVGITLSGLSNCAGLVLAPTTEAPLKHIEFINLRPGRALVVLVTAEGVVENRILEVPTDIPAFAFTEATNYLNARLVGATLAEVRNLITMEIKQSRLRLNKLSAKVVEAGLATWGGDERSSATSGTLIIRGQANLLDDLSAMDDLEQIRSLFVALENDETMLKLLDLADTAEGVQIFIGADNELFNLSGCSFIVAPYHSGSNQLVGAIGIIGPTRMNYARIIPMVDYTAKLISKIIR